MPKKPGNPRKYPVFFRYFRVLPVLDAGDRRGLLVGLPSRCSAGLTLATVVGEPNCCSVVTVNTSNTVQLLTFDSSRPSRDRRALSRLGVATRIPLSLELSTPVSSRSLALAFRSGSPEAAVVVMCPTLRPCRASAPSVRIFVRGSGRRQGESLSRVMPNKLQKHVRVRIGSLLITLSAVLLRECT